MLNLKITLAVCLCVLTIAACKRSPRQEPQPQPRYNYRSLQDKEVRYLKPFSLDVDGDATDDVFFVVGLLNDQTGTRALYTVVALEAAKMLGSPQDLALLQNGAEIPALPLYPQEWNGYTNLMCEMLLPRLNPLDTTWSGNWVAAGKKFMGMQFRSRENTYLGWISASVDTARDCMILHDCAWRHINAGPVKAGTRAE